MASDYAGFIATVEREADVPHDQAERAVTATLETLGERISGGEAHDLAGQLPPELQRLVDRHAGDDSVADALMATITGIAAGLRNTG